MVSKGVEAAAAVEERYRSEVDDRTRPSGRSACALTSTRVGQSG